MLQQAFGFPLLLLCFQGFASTGEGPPLGFRDPAPPLHQRLAPSFARSAQNPQLAPPPEKSAPFPEPAAPLPEMLAPIPWCPAPVPARIPPPLAPPFWTHGAVASRFPPPPLSFPPSLPLLLSEPSRPS